ncbi:hypothetical protein C356_03068 [Cryptococcus neoformans c45]|nr:hypothetical protein C356_03068 [Cryptococcus neoformans var. grubii c45]
MASANCDPTPTLEHMTVVEAQSPTNWWTQELDNFQAITRGDLSKGPYTVFSLPPLATGLPSMPKLLNIAATSWASIGILVMPKWLWSIVQLALTVSTLVSR